MMLRLSVRDAATSATWDIEVTADPDSSVASLLAALPVRVGGRMCFVGVEPLHPQLTIGASPLVRGCTVTVGAPGPDPRRPRLRTGVADCRQCAGNRRRPAAVGSPAADPAVGFAEPGRAFGFRPGIRTGPGDFTHRGHPAHQGDRPAQHHGAAGVGPGSVGGGWGTGRDLRGEPWPGLETPTLHGVPVTVDLRATGVLGVVGPTAAASTLLRWLLVQLGTLRSPDDLRIVVITSTESDELVWTAWLPHVDAGEAGSSPCWIGNQAARRITFEIPASPAGVRYVYPCRLGEVTAVRANGVDLPLTGADVQLPAGTTHAEISYR